MMKSAAIFFLFFIHVGAFSQLQPYNKAVIWRGFRHQWTYNHRCNRLGDYVQFNDGNPRAAHTSATGIGQDSTYFTSYYSFVSTPDAVFKEGVASVKIEGKEKHLVEKTITVNVKADDWLRNKGHYVTLLNGFDLRSAKAPDKIQLLRFSIEDGEYLKATNEIQLRINVSLVFTCKSVECQDFNNKIDYDLDIYYLIIGVNEHEATSTEKFFTRSYSWDRKDEVGELCEEKVTDGLAENIFNDAALGIKSFSFVLNAGHWLVEMNDNLIPIFYDPNSGDMKLCVDLFFKEWQEGMRGTDVAPGKSKFAEKRKGWAVLDIATVLLQFRKAEIVHSENSGRMFWKGHKEYPDNINSISVYSIPKK